MTKSTNDIANPYDWVAARGEKWRAQFVGMEATLAPVDEPLLRALKLEAPSRIADIGCGAGGTALAVVRRSPKGSVVCGFDLSPALIELARTRTRPDEPISFEVADAATATPAQPYDRLVSRFGIMFFDEPAGAFANLVRWLAPGGRFAFAVWGQPAENPWISRAREVVAELVEVPSPDPEGPGPFRYARAGTFVTLLERAGFGDVQTHEWRGTLPIGGGLPAAEAANFALAAFSSFGELLAQAGDAALSQARQSLTARFSEQEEGGVVRMDASVHILTGVRAPPTLNAAGRTKRNIG